MKSRPRDFWDIIQVIALISTPLVLALLGAFGSLSTQRTPRVTAMVEHAMQILQRPPSEEQRGLRKWAVQLIEAESGIRFDETTREQLQDSLAFPSAGVAGQVQQYIVDAAFVFLKYATAYSLQLADQDRLVGIQETDFLLKNTGPNTEKYEIFLREKSGLDNALCDSLLICTDVKRGDTIAVWRGGIDLTDKVSLEVVPGATLRIHRFSKLSLKRTDHIYLVVTRPTEKMEVTMSLPNVCQPDVFFLHPGRSDRNQCNLVTGMVISGYVKFKATINNGILPFQGFFINWRDIELR